MGNRGAPAVAAELILQPASDLGRFDLLVDGQVAAAAAGNRTVAGPVAVSPGLVTVAQRAADGTDPDLYESSIGCWSGSGPPVAVQPGSSATVNVAAGETLACALVNVRRAAPPEPPPGPQPAPIPPRFPPLPGPVAVRRAAQVRGRAGARPLPDARRCGSVSGRAGRSRWQTAGR